MVREGKKKKGWVSQLSLDSNQSLGISGSLYIFGVFTMTISGNWYTVYYIRTRHDILFDVMGVQVCHHEF